MEDTKKYKAWSLLMEIVSVIVTLSDIRLFATPWTGAHWAPPSMEFSRQEYWNRLPFPSPPHPCSMKIINKQFIIGTEKSFI